MPTVSTTTVSEILQTTATCGGNVTSDGGATVTARGVCWSTASNPTIDNNKTIDGNGTGNFISSLSGLTANTLYFVRAYATNSAGTAYGVQLEFTTTGSSGGQPCPGTPTVVYEGKTYNTVLIGTQCWLKENLDVGTRINVSQNQNATNGTLEKYCYNDLESNCAVYGGLYQWDEIMQGSATPGIQGICPSGWHIPTDAEWKQLEMALGMSQSEADATGWQRGTDEGGKMKETGTTHWDSPNTGATNSSGFTALPGGFSNSGGSFGAPDVFGYWWSSTGYSGNGAWSRGLYFYYAQVDRGMSDGWGGSSVRCLKN